VKVVSRSSDFDFTLLQTQLPRRFFGFLEINRAFQPDEHHRQTYNAIAVPLADSWSHAHAQQARRESSLPASTVVLNVGRVDPTAQKIKLITRRSSKENWPWDLKIGVGGFVNHCGYRILVQNKATLSNKMLQPDSPSPAIVLVVDDEEANRVLLRDPLEARGYSVIEASHGPQALEMAVSHRPDIILLDLLMPGMDGFAVCQRLQNDPELKQIPVIFVSAIHETIAKVKALHLGGVDYLTKPVRQEEVEARVRTHLELQRQKRKVQDNYDKLRRSEQLRSNLTHMIVHDLRSPLTTIHMVLELVQKYIPPEDPQLGRLVQVAQTGAATIEGMTRQLLDIYRMEAGQMPLQKTEWDLSKAIQEILQNLAPSAGGRKLVLVSSRSLITFSDSGLIKRVIQNIVGNAIKFTPTSAEINISLSASEQEVRVVVTDNGPGIPAKYHQRIFELFGQAEDGNKTTGTGLGLAFCKLAVGAHGGLIGVESELGQGSSFWFTLPSAQAEIG
jgi:signal transduction histidine kinase